MKKLLNKIIQDFILPEYKHVICDIEVKDPNERFDTLGGTPFKSPSVTITFIGGRGTKLWPVTQGIQKMYDDVMDEVWHTIYDYTETAVDIYSNTTKDCGKENIYLKEHIKKVLKEETQKIKKRTPLEKAVTTFIESLLEDYDLPENFKGVAVDIVDGGKECHITGLFENSFNQNDSDKLFSVFNKIKKEIPNYFGDQFYYVTTGNSTINNYNDHQWWYDKKKSINESKFFRRRIDMVLMDKEFYEYLNIVTSLSLERILNNVEFNFNDFNDGVITHLIDAYYMDLSDNRSNKVPYDEIYDFLSKHYYDKIKDRYDSLFTQNINELFNRKDIRRRTSEFNEENIIRLIKKEMSETDPNDYSDEYDYASDIISWVIPHFYPYNEHDPKYEDTYEEIDDFMKMEYGGMIFDYFNKINPEINDLNESENKKYGLLRPIEENGLFQVMQDTGLSFQQIISKTGELSREVLERYIRDFINEEGYHQTNGDAVFYLSVVLSKDKIAETFYLSGDKVTVEVNEYGKYSVQIGGFVESLSNFTDEEIYMVVKGMIDWGNNSDLNESFTGVTATDTTQQLINKPVKIVGDVNTNTIIQNVNINKDGSVNIAFKNGINVKTSLPMLRTFNVGVNIPLEFKVKKKTIVTESKILDKIKGFFGKKPLTKEEMKDEKVINLIVKFINESYTMKRASKSHHISIYLVDDKGDTIFPKIMEYFPDSKILNYSWDFAKDIHNMIGDNRLLHIDSEMMGKVFEKLFKKKVNIVRGYSEL